MQLDGSEIGIPDRPGIDPVGRKGGQRIGRRQIHGLDIAEGQPGLLQGGEYEHLRGRAPDEGQALAAQIRQGGRRRLFRHDDRGTGARDLLAGDVDQLAAMRLGRNRRRVAGGADIDCTGTQRIEQRRTGREDRPVERRDTARRQPLRDLAARLGQNRSAAFLMADPKPRPAPRPQGWTNQDGKGCRTQQAAPGQPARCGGPDLIRRKRPVRHFGSALVKIPRGRYDNILPLSMLY